MNTPYSLPKKTVRRMREKVLRRGVGYGGDLSGLAFRRCTSHTLRASLLSCFYLAASERANIYQPNSLSVCFIISQNKEEGVDKKHYMYVSAESSYPKLGLLVQFSSKKLVVNQQCVAVHLVSRSSFI
nr:hypothetical protein Iba_chr11aCG1220 [Ipomoea batatas]